MWDPDDKSVVYDRPGVLGLGLSVIRKIVVGHESCNLHGSLSNIYRMFINTFLKSADVYRTYPTYNTSIKTFKP